MNMYNVHKYLLSQGRQNRFELGQDLPQHTQTWLGPDFKTFYNYPKNQFHTTSDQL